MQCLKCTNEASSGNALCPSCFESSTKRRNSIVQAWSSDREIANGRTAISEPEAEDSTAVHENSPPPSEALPEQNSLPLHPARILAFLCDSALLMVIVIVVQKAAIAISGISLQEILAVSNAQGSTRALAFMETIKTLLLIQTVGLAVPTLIYYIAFEASSWAATPGKKILGLGVRSAADEVLSVDAIVKRVIVRSAPIWPAVLLPNLLSPSCVFAGLFITIMFIVVGLSFVVTFADPLTVLITGNRQALHDIVARTQVVQVTTPIAANYVVAVLLTVCAFVIYIALNIAL